MMAATDRGYGMRTAAHHGSGSGEPRRRGRDDGFTLIEMLIVILILGTLAAIAILATKPFEDRARQACIDVNVIMDRVAEAAERAGVEPEEIYAEQGDCPDAEAAGATVPAPWIALASVVRPRSGGSRPRESFQLGGES